MYRGILGVFSADGTSGKSHSNTFGKKKSRGDLEAYERRRRSLANQKLWFLLGLAPILA